MKTGSHAPITETGGAVKVLNGLKSPTGRDFTAASLPASFQTIQMSERRLNDTSGDHTEGSNLFHFRYRVKVRSITAAGEKTQSVI